MKKRLNNKILSEKNREGNNRAKNMVDIEINEEKCTGCIVCELICSFTYNKTFSPKEAFIKITDRYCLRPKIAFLESCIKCGQCAKHCLYGALTIKGSRA